jgi:hypothetical protein
MGFASKILLKGIKGLEKAQGVGSYDSIEGRQEERGDVMKSKKHVLLVVRIDVEPEMEEEFNRWYNEEHIPGLLKVPGVLWAKRGINTGKGPKYIAVYEHESIDVQHSEAYRKVTETEWTRKLEPHLLKRERDVYELL